MSLESTAQVLLEAASEEGKTHAAAMKEQGFTKSSSWLGKHKVDHMKSHETADTAKESVANVHKHLESQGYKKAAKTFSHDIFRHPETKKEVTVGHNTRSNTVTVTSDK